jgi:hypothetical protein
LRSWADDRNAARPIVLYDFYISAITERHRFYSPFRPSFGAFSPSIPEATMLDLVFLALGGVCLAICGGYVLICDRL